MKTKNLVLCGLFVALIAVGAFIKVPVPVVPFTLQFFFTTLAGLILGKNWGALSVLVYVILGLCGLPVFAQGGGIGYVLQPSFGYLLGFIAGTWVTGYIAHKVYQPSVKRLFCACFTGLIIVYLLGMVYYWCISHFYLGTNIGVWPLILYCFLLAVPGDIVLCLISVAVGKQIIPLIQKNIL